MVLTKPANLKFHENPDVHGALRPYVMIQEINGDAPEKTVTGLYLRIEESVRPYDLGIRPLICCTKKGRQFWRPFSHG